MSTRRNRDPKWRKERNIYYVLCVIWVIFVLVGVLIQSRPMLAVGSILLLIAFYWAGRLDGNWGKWKRNPNENK